MSEFPNKLKSFNWRKFFFRLTLVISIGLSIVGALSSEYPLREAFLVFIGVWIWYGIIHLIVRVLKWVWRGLIERSQ